MPPVVPRLALFGEDRDEAAPEVFDLDGRGRRSRAPGSILRDRPSMTARTSSSQVRRERETRPGATLSSSSPDELAAAGDERDLPDAEAGLVVGDHAGECRRALGVAGEDVVGDRGSRCRRQQVEDHHLGCSPCLSRSKAIGTGGERLLDGPRFRLEVGGGEVAERGARSRLGRSVRRMSSSWSPPSSRSRRGPDSTGRERLWRDGFPWEGTRCRSHRRPARPGEEGSNSLPTITNTVSSRRLEPRASPIAAKRAQSESI